MVVFCSFTLAQLTTFPDYPNVFGINQQAFNILFCSGLPGVVLTITIAQLTPSLLAKEYPLRFLNIPGIYHIILVALYLEKSGIMHFVYVLYGILNSIFFSKSSEDGIAKKLDQFIVPSISDLETFRGKNVLVSVAVDQDSEEERSEGTSNSECVSSITLNTVSSSPAPLRTATVLEIEKTHDWEENGPDRTPQASKKSSFVTEMISLDDKDKMSLCTTVVLYLKYTLSTFVTALCFVFVFYCLATGHSLIKLSLPLQIFFLFLSMVIITYCEGMKVSIVSTTHIDSDDLKDTHRIAYKVHKLLNYDTSEGVKKFLLGRQLTVVPLGFFIASLTHFIGLNEDQMPYGLYFILVTAGLPGVMILLQVAQLTPQLLAEQNNIAFINLPGSYVLAKWALFVESFGIVNVTWLIYYALDKVLCRSNLNSMASTDDYDQLDTSGGSGLLSLCYESEDSSEVSSPISNSLSRSGKRLSEHRDAGVNPMLKEPGFSLSSHGVEC